jgi:peroxiredoxin
VTAALAGALALAFQGWVLVNLLRQNGRLLLRLDALEAAAGQPPLPHGMPRTPSGLPVGQEAPPFTLPGVFGETLTLESLTALGRPVLLVFVDPGCSPCNAMMPEVAGWQRHHGGDITIALVTTGGLEANRAKASEHGITRVLVQNGREVADAYGAPPTPGAVRVDARGTIASPLVAGAEAIRTLMRNTLAGVRPVPVALGRPPGSHHGNGNQSGRRPSTPGVGQAAPHLSLPDLSGATLRLSDYRGQELLLLFWDPQCGFCQQMLGDLRAWEAEAGSGAPKLVVVSNGGVEANRALGLQAPVLLDESNQVMRSFGATGTPMAVLIDADGLVASELGVGASGVFALANRREAARL